MRDKNIGYKKYNYLSRYASVPLMVDNKGRTYHGIPKWVKVENASTYTCEQGDTLEKIAYQQYGSPVLWWLVAEANRIIDPTRAFEMGQKIKLVSLGDIGWEKR